MLASPRGVIAATTHPESLCWAGTLRGQWNVVRSVRREPKNWVLSPQSSVLTITTQNSQNSVFSVFALRCSLLCVCPSVFLSGALLLLKLPPAAAAATAQTEPRPSLSAQCAVRRVAPSLRHRVPPPPAPLPRPTPPRTSCLFVPLPPPAS